MEWVAILGLAQQYGTPALLVVVLVVLLVLVNDLKANAKADKATRDTLRKEIGESETRWSEAHKALEARTKTLELEYLSKAEFFREVGGWRSDMERLSDKMDAQAKETRDLVINLWKSKAEEGKKT